MPFRMRTTVLCPLTLAALATFWTLTPSASGQTKSAPPDKSAAVDKADLNVISMEVAALHVMHQLELSSAQMQTLSRMLGRGVNSKNKPRQAAKGTPKFRKGLTDLRDALLKGNAKQISDLSEKLDKLYDTEKVELDDVVEVTEAARRKAPELLKVLNARQVLAYLLSYEGEVPDPVDRLQDALKHGKGADAAAWKQLRDAAAEDFGWMVAGFDVDKAQKVQTEIASVLDRHHRAEKQGEAPRADLEKVVHRLMGDIGPTDVLRHILERDLAELMSNPRLPALLEMRLASAKK